MRTKIIEQAKKWLNKKEKDSSFKEIIDIYNSHRPLARGYKVKYTDEWCAAFVSAVAIKCGLTDIIPLECSCGKMIELAVEKGIWREDDTYIPAIADIILYDWGDSGKGDNTGWPEHIGIVTDVKNGKITVIEGNLNNKVGYRDIAVNGKHIRGYICPVYENEVKKEETKTMKYFELLEQMNMRATPNGTKLGTVPKGTVINGTELIQNGDTTWLLTTYNGVNGCVCVLPASRGYAKEITAPAPEQDYKVLYETEKAKAETLQNKINEIKELLV
jgi:hypothetical protein